MEAAGLWGCEARRRRLLAGGGRCRSPRGRRPQLEAQVVTEAEEEEEEVMEEVVGLFKSNPVDP